MFSLVIHSQQLRAEAMNKLKKSQILMLSVLAVFLTITPLLSSSLRPTYLYFVFNLLIIALGAEAGFLSAFSDSSDNKKSPFPPPPPHLSSSNSAAMAAAEHAGEKDRLHLSSPDQTSDKKVKIGSEKTVGSYQKVKKCPSTPSLFFIGGGGEEYEDEGYEEAIEEETGGINGQELFTKAETFIGNFYKQLKMQREESWKKIHGFYQKAF